MYRCVAAGHQLRCLLRPAPHDDDDDTQVYKDHGDALTIAYQSGYYDGKKAALAGREWNFCERCGKRTADLTVIHTCTPPQRKPLTDEEHDQLMRGRSTLHYGRAVEAAHGIKE